MRIAYFGLPLGALVLLADGHDLALVTLSPVPAPGRRRLRRVAADARVIDAAALPSDRVSALVSESLSNAAPDLIVSWYWTRRLPEAWLGSARLGGVGVHPSLLPRHRGPNPFFWAIDSGDVASGVTVHRLERDYDTGPIIAQRRVPVGERDAWQLARALDGPGLSLLRDVVLRAARGEALEGVAQDERQATWAGEPEGPLLAVRWAWPTARVLRRIRALAPVPGLALELGGQPLFVTRARAAEHYPEVLLPGEAAVAGHPEQVVIRTGDGAVGLLGATRLTAQDDPVQLDARALASTLRETSGGIGPTGR